jgi:hypothetical protein
VPLYRYHDNGTGEGEIREDLAKWGGTTNWFVPGMGMCGFFICLDFGAV